MSVFYTLTDANPSSGVQAVRPETQYPLPIPAFEDPNPPQVQPEEIPFPLLVCVCILSVVLGTPGLVIIYLLYLEGAFKVYQFPPEAISPRTKFPFSHQPLNFENITLFNLTFSE